MSSNFEDRLSELREEARAKGQVAGNGARIEGGPLPAANHRNGAQPGYYGLPMVKPPVWTWEIPVYFFVGGMAGMAAVLAPLAWLSGNQDLARAANELAAFGGVVSPVLLVMDLGRPLLFLNMLRVFKYQSAMSMGAWILSVFGSCAVPAMMLLEIDRWLVHSGWLSAVCQVLAFLLMLGGAVTGSLLATYTGVLIGATAIPAWAAHHRLLPFHFGMAGLGSAVSILELCGHHLLSIMAMALVVALAETITFFILETQRHGQADRAVHEGATGRTIRLAGLFTGPGAFVLRLAGFFFFPVNWLADILFLSGAFMHRMGWIETGRVSGKDPEATIAAQTTNIVR